MESRGFSACLKTSVTEDGGGQGLGGYKLSKTWGKWGKLVSQ